MWKLALLVLNVRQLKDTCLTLPLSQKFIYGAADFKVQSNALQRDYNYGQLHSIILPPWKPLQNLLPAAESEGHFLLQRSTIWQVMKAGDKLLSSLWQQQDLQKAGGEQQSESLCGGTPKLCCTCHNLRSLVELEFVIKSLEVLWSTKGLEYSLLFFVVVAFLFIWLTILQC